MQLARLATREIQSLPGDTPVTRVMTVAQSMEKSIQEPRLRTMLIGLFATIALLLAAAGIYAVMAYSVSQRTREFGVRLALGARGGHICSAVVREAVVITATGALAGIAAASELMRGLERFLFGVTSWDALTYVSTCRNPDAHRHRGQYIAGVEGHACGSGRNAPPGLTAA